MPAHTSSELVSPVRFDARLGLPPAVNLVAIVNPVRFELRPPVGEGSGLRTKTLVVAPIEVYVRWSGRHKVAGTAKKKVAGVLYPVLARICLVAERERVVVRETWSDPVTGAYQFSYVDGTLLYTVLGYEVSGTYNAEAADRIAPEPM